MPVTRCVLHGKSIRTLDDLYDHLSRCFNFPEYFGRNLDALYDVLSTDIEGPLQIIWEDAETSKKTMGDDFKRVSALFRDLARERTDFSITFL